MEEFGLLIFIDFWGFSGISEFPEEDYFSFDGLGYDSTESPSEIPPTFP